ncbi:MAG: NUDIX hydrolase [Balneolaceae bacterium]
MEKKKSNSNPGPEKELTEYPLHSSHIFDGKLLQVYLDEVKLPDGTTSTREWIKHPGASAVVPVFEDGTIMLLKQFRYPSRKIFLEVPAGKVDPGEDPISTARRELAEESGLSCTHLANVGSFYPAIGYADEIIHVYAAWGLTTEQQNVDDDEFVITSRIPFSQALLMIQTGEISDGKTICSLIKTHLWWKTNTPFKVQFS